MADLTLLTGLPGVGKTTAVERLVARRPEVFARIHFGGLLREAAGVRLGATFTPAQFRATFAQLLIAADLVAASRAARDVADRSVADVCILDTHAVTPTAAGLRATPDDAERIAILRVTGLVHISSACVSDRVARNSASQGRWRMPLREVPIAESMQLSVATAYSAAYGCPLLVVSGAGTAEELVDRVETALLSVTGRG